MKTVNSKFKFQGGVHPQYRKDATAGKPVETLPLPGILAISMSQHLGAPAKCVVKPGDKIVKGQLVGERNGFISAAVFASASGTVKAVEPRPGPTGAYADAVILETEASDEFLRMDPIDWRKAAKEELLARVADAGLCGMGGAGFPTAVKLAPPPGKRCEYFVINGAECEPYLTSDCRLMIERPDDIRAGAEIARKILGGPAVRIAVEENKPESIAALEKSFADMEGNVEIVVLPVRYPQGSEKHQIYSTTGRTVPDGGLPIDAGCVVENVSTVAALAAAVLRGEPPVQRITTVSGDGVKDPKNVLAPAGTRYSDLVAFAGGAKDGVRKIISGGPMMGFNVPNLGIATTKTTSGLLLFTGGSVFQYSSHACINCGSCLRACPMRLNPAAISRAVEADDIADAERRHVMSCIECGSCSFSCPAWRDVTQFCRRAKASIRARIAAERAKARQAKNA